MIFSPAASDDYEKQYRLLQDQSSGFEERDLLTTVFLETDDANAEAVGARATYNVEAGSFAVVLIGRDGTQKYRSNTPVTAPSLFEKIDASPCAAGRWDRVSAVSASGGEEVRILPASIFRLLEVFVAVFPG